MLEVIDTMTGGNTDLLVAGAMGGVVRWLSLKDDWVDGIVSVIIGSICAVYLHSLAIPLIEPTVGKIIADPTAHRSLSGFIIGVGGVSVSGFIVDAWALKRRKTQPEDN